jgi:PHS family inorganic phosphate transporter-like MFS transporter
VSAHSGKCGGVLTAFAFGTVAQAIGLQAVLGMFVGLMVLVALLTGLIPETKDCTLEDLENDVLYKRTRKSGEAAAENGCDPVAENVTVTGKM